MLIDTTSYQSLSKTPFRAIQRFYVKKITFFGQGTEGATGCALQKKLFLKIPQNSLMPAALFEKRL